ncbi:MAG: hypothetical protein KGL39_17890 [Patescibacteria group bacterium]|nr:hypothetical protein [Patescibacteria group bacterium]
MQPWEAAAQQSQAPSQQPWDVAARMMANQKPQGEDMGAMGAAIQGFNRMVPFGNRLTAAAGSALAYPIVNTVGSPESFGQLYNEARANQAATEQAHPVATDVGTGAGFVNSLLLGAGGKASTPMIGEAANGVNQTLSSVGNWVRGGALAKDASIAAKTGNIVGQMGRSAAVAAPVSALYAYGNSPNDLDSQAALSDAGSGARMGAAVGAALPLVAPVIGAAGNLIGKGVSGVTNALTKSVPEKAENVAATQLRNALQRDQINLQNLPVDQTLLQAGDNGIQARAEAIAQRNNPAADQLADYAVQRKLALPNEISDSINGQFPETNFPKMLEGIKQQAYANAKPAYEAAYEANTRINDPQINDLLDQVVNAGDWSVLKNEAQKIAAYDGRKLGNIDATGMARSYSTEDLDYMTRALRNLGQSTEGMGAFGGKTPLGAQRLNTAMAIRGRLAEINPAFGDATQRYADDVAIKNAAEEGKSANLFGNNWKSAVYDYNQLPNKTTKAAWRLGQAENLQTQIARNPSAALRQFNSPQFQKVMRTFYSPQELADVTDTLNGLLSEQQGLSKILGNSRTALRAGQQADDAALVGEHPASVAMDVATKGPRGALMSRAADYIGNKFTNSPVQQKADQLVTQQLLATPFDRAGWEATQGDTALNRLSQISSTPSQAASVPVRNRPTLPAVIGNAIAGTSAPASTFTLPQAIQSTAPQQQQNMKPRSDASDFLTKERMAESGGNPNAKNPNSTASGPYQFTDGTWKDMVAKYGQQTGIGLADKNNPKAQETMARLYAADNVNTLNSVLGRMPTKGELYAAHVLGPTGAARLIRTAATQNSRDAALLFPPEVVNANKSLFFNGGKPRTAIQLYQLLSSKV